MSKIFVSTATNSSEESSVVKEVINQLNLLPSETSGFEYIDRDLIRSSKRSRVDRSDIASSIKAADVFIGVLWSPQAKAVRDSFVQDDLEIALDALQTKGSIQIKLFLNNEPISLSLLSSIEEIEKLESILKLKRKIEQGVKIPVSMYAGIEDFRDQVRSFLTTLVEGVNRKGTGSPLPLYIYRLLFEELDLYIAQFEQLRRDYEREDAGSDFVFAVDYSEIYGYLRYDSIHPSINDRGGVNTYIFKNLRDRLTLMPGAIGELLTDVEKYLPPKRFLSKNYINAFSAVIEFVAEYPSKRDDEQATLVLYRRVERELREVWGDFFDVVVTGSGQAYYTPYGKLRDLIKDNRLVPVEAIQHIDSFPNEVQKAAQIVRDNLNTKRPMKPINNKVDVIDFSVTWLLNENSGSENTYYCLYTQSNTLIRACTISHDLKWSDDFLVRGANYLKFRTKLQNLTFDERLAFVKYWEKFCRDLQREFKRLAELGSSKRLNQTDSLVFLNILDKFRQFDQKCRQFLQLHDPSDDTVMDVGSFEGSEYDLKNAKQLYERLNNDPSFTASMEQAYEIVKGHLESLTKELHLFAPNKADPANVRKYKLNLEKWLDSSLMGDETKDR